MNALPPPLPLSAPSLASAPAPAAEEPLPLLLATLGEAEVLRSALQAHARQAALPQSVRQTAAGLLDALETLIFERAFRGIPGLRATAHPPLSRGVHAGTPA